MPRALRFLAPFGVVLIAACGSTTPAASPSATPTPVTASTPTAPAPTPAPMASLPSSCRGIPAAIGTPMGCHLEASDFLKSVNDAVAALEDFAGDIETVTHIFLIDEQEVLHGGVPLVRVPVKAGVRPPARFTV